MSDQVFDILNGEIVIDGAALDYVGQAWNDRVVTVERCFWEIVYALHISIQSETEISSCMSILVSSLPTGFSSEQCTRNRVEELRLLFSVVFHVFLSSHKFSCLLQVREQFLAV